MPGPDPLGGGSSGEQRGAQDLRGGEQAKQVELHRWHAQRDGRDAGPEVRGVCLLQARRRGRGVLDRRRQRLLPRALHASAGEDAEEEGHLQRGGVPHGIPEEPRRGGQGERRQAADQEPDGLCGRFQGGFRRLLSLRGGGLRRGHGAPGLRLAPAGRDPGPREQLARRLLQLALALQVFARRPSEEAGSLEEDHRREPGEQDGLLVRRRRAVHRRGAPRGRQGRHESGEIH
mmetsp:Transcript_3495/g.9832  ORF Transcript_3495/g.9832 Transcript_3495/m.9832 type:complete len:232 (+) Transcript_3495:748-1443(+)